VSALFILSSEPMKKRIVLCADDYGQAPEISEGIISLLAKERLSAVSCMVNTRDWLHHAHDLQVYQAKVDIGLHLNLTEGQALSNAYRKVYGSQFYPLPTLMRKAWLHQLEQTVLEAECHAQLDHFANTLGFLPHFLDGHQHVHQFPIIRSAFLKVYQERFATQKAYIRLAQEKLNWTDCLRHFKKIIINAAGSHVFSRLLKQRHIPHNHSFSGIYSFQEAERYACLFPRFLKTIADKGLIMCHPGLLASTKDKMTEARNAEYHYFSSVQFLNDCEQAKVLCVKGLLLF
jgi:chitin disaccharide deacetylase